MMYTKQHSTAEHNKSIIILSIHFNEMLDDFEYIEHAIQTFHTISQVANKQVQIFTMICRQNPHRHFVPAVACLLFLSRK